MEGSDGGSGAGDSEKIVPGGDGVLYASMMTAETVGLPMGEFWKINSWELLQIVKIKRDLMDKRNSGAAAMRARNDAVPTTRQLQSKIFGLFGAPDDYVKPEESNG